MKTTKLFLCGLVLLGACTTESGKPGTSTPAGDGVYTIPNPIDPCGARTVQFLKGRPESALKGRRYAAPIRLLRHGDQVDAKDVNPNRLTVTISQDGRIASLSCG